MEKGSDDRLELALRASNEGIWDWNLLTDEISYSDRVLAFLGYSKEEMPHLFRIAVMVHPDDLAEFERAVSEVLAPDGENLLAIEPRIRTSGGEWRWLRIRGIVVRGESGAAVRMAGSVIDISKRRIAEEQLREERHLMRLLIESVPLNIYFKDRDSRFTLVNQAQADFFGKTSDELAGHSDHEFLNPKQADRTLEHEREILATDKPIFGILEPVKIAGDKETWMLTNKMPLHDRRGHLQGTFGVSSDVTELIQTQQSLAEVAIKLKRQNDQNEEELALAREVQQALLPSVFPTVPGGLPQAESRVKFGHRYIPISGLAGDFFEVFQVSDHEVGLFICDVMGVGVRSAVIVSMLRGLAERAIESAADPATFLTELNAGLSRILLKAQVTMFATAFFALTDFEAGVLRYASAGHRSGIIANSEGACSLPLGGRGAGPALGLFREGKYETQSVKLSTFDRLLLFTDGIFEVANSTGDAFLENRLVKVFGDPAVQGIEAHLDRVLERVRTFAENDRFDDDVSLLGMEIVG